ncbi:hypothetical protein PG984_011458 [Apiospora sp. TS-2023a]
MRFFALVPFISTLAGLALASPVPDDVSGLKAKSDIFKYCTGASFSGNCNRDDESSLNHCETVSFKTIMSLKVYNGYKCTIYMASGCTGDDRSYTAGEVPTIPTPYQDFKSYKCVKA